MATRELPARRVWVVPDTQPNARLVRLENSAADAWRVTFQRAERKPRASGKRARRARPLAGYGLGQGRHAVRSAPAAAAAARVRRPPLGPKHGRKRARPPAPALRLLVVPFASAAPARRGPVAQSAGPGPLWSRPPVDDALIDAIKRANGSGMVGAMEALVRLRAGRAPRGRARPEQIPEKATPFARAQLQLRLRHPARWVPGGRPLRRARGTDPRPPPLLPLSAAAIAALKAQMRADIDPMAAIGAATVLWSAAPALKVGRLNEEDFLAGLAELAVAVAADTPSPSPSPSRPVQALMALGASAKAHKAPPTDAEAAWYRRVRRTRLLA